MALDHALDLSLKWSQFPLCSFHMAPSNSCTYESPTKQIILRINRDFLSPLVPKIKATFLSSTNMLLVARTPHICIYCAQHICVMFHPYLLPKHVCLRPPSQVTVHLAKNWVGKQKFGSRVYFKPETFQTGKRGENSQNKSNWQGNWNCPHFVTFPVLSSFRYFPHVEGGGKRNPAFCPTCPWVHTKAFQGWWMLGPVRQNWCIL